MAVQEVILVGAPAGISIPLSFKFIRLSVIVYDQCRVILPKSRNGARF